MGPNSFRIDDVVGLDSVIFVRSVNSEPPVNFLICHTTCFSLALYSADCPTVPVPTQSVATNHGAQRFTSETSTPHVRHHSQRRMQRHRQ